MGFFDALNKFMYKGRYVCAVCGKVISIDESYEEIITGHTGICLECMGGLAWIPSEVRFYSKFDIGTEIIAPLYYKETIRKILHDYKFNGCREYSSVLAFIICHYLDEPNIKLPQRFDMIVPVPLSEKRFRERGYNQSALVAQKVAKYFGIEYCEKALWRTRNTKKQSLAANKDERYLNVLGAFEADKEIVSGKRILIFDDIYTYGYTVSECVKAVKNAGAQKASALVCAAAINGRNIIT